MYRAPSKRRQLITRAVIYSVMTLAVVILVTFLVFVMLGYRFNRDTSTIQQGGLVQFASRPIDASVTIGKAKLTDLTPSKITVNPGTYNVSMAKRGYSGWSKSVDVQAGEVLWLNYAQLVPESIETKQLTRFDTVAGVKSSPNGDRFAILGDAAKPVITFVDVTGSAPKQTTLTIPSSVLPEGKTATFTLGDWANDSDRLLVNMTYDQTTERLIVDRRAAGDTINVTRTYQTDIAEALFDPRSSERLIVRAPTGDVRMVDTGSDSLSDVVASSVSSMSMYGDDAILVVQAAEGGTQSVGYVSLGSDKVRVLRRISSTDTTKVAAATYFSEPHLAITVGSELDVYKIRSLPSSDSDASISMSRQFSADLPAPATFLSVRSGGRFVLAQYAGGVQTYDVELGKQTITSLATPTEVELRWLDRYHFYLTTGTNLEVLEFDGGNPHQITALSTGFDVVQSDDGKFIYSVNAIENGFVIQQSRMILE